MAEEAGSAVYVMYGKNARNSLMAAMKDAPEMKLGRFPNARGKEGPISDTLLRQLTDRIILELWHRGFALSARSLLDYGNRDPELHRQWRSTKMKPSKDGVQTDVEAGRPHR